MLFRSKFGFDKIITVCDYDNIKKIYAHLYGADTDFNGYINKFTPCKEYNYSLKSRIIEHVKNHWLDTEFKKFPVISHLLSERIVGTLDSNKLNLTNNSLRVIKQKLLKRTVKKKTIHLLKYDQNIHVNTDHIFIRYLDILKEFDINDNILNNISINNDYTKYELYKFIDIYWLVQLIICNDYQIINDKNYVRILIDNNFNNSIFIELIVENEVINFNVKTIHNDELLMEALLKKLVLLNEFIITNCII